MMYFRKVFKSLPVLLFCFLFFAFHVRAAITIDNASSNGAFNAAGVTTLSWTHETGAGSNRALFVGVSTSTTTLPVGVPTERVASVTYNGVALTRVGTAISPNSLNTSEIFRLVNPPTGANTVEVTLASVPVVGNPFVNYVVGGAITFLGVSQTAPNGAFFPASGSSGSPSVIVTDSVAGDIVLDTLAVSPNAIFIAPGAGQIERWDGQTFFGNAFDIGAGSTEAATSPLTTMSWIMTAPDNWALGAVAVRQFITTAASVSVGGRLTTQSGRGAGNARVRMVDEDGNSRVAITSPFGYYRFENVQVGEVYTFTVESKQYNFEPRAVFVGEELNNLDFIVKQ
ncbi:MAG TPA: carboxypeptidase-like regulatory domain-containing protein [Pyrinomonadaceae bacterium]|nr:carboxypeptidase-like regulatory domain-containing protein [Pyrinomonadaceae bacterium]